MSKPTKRQQMIFWSF